MIIGVTGYKRSGKDTVAAVLVEKYGYTRVALADPLKDMALAIDPFVEIPTYRTANWDESHAEQCYRLSSVVDLYGWEKAKGFEDVRRFLQRLGSEGVRDTLGPDAWILRLRRTLTGMPYLIAAHRCSVPRSLKVVIPDVRFPNEAEAIREMGGQIWKVMRPGHNGDGHQSERGVAEIRADIMWNNSGSIEDLHALLAEHGAP